jgi:hypothetical protein
MVSSWCSKGLNALAERDDGFWPGGLEASTLNDAPAAKAIVDGDRPRADIN